MSGCMISAIVSLLFASTLVFLPGCAASPNQGYAFDSTFDESMSTIAVPIFQNETTSRGIEVQLTEAVIKQIQQRTPWRLSTGDRADTTLVGVVTGSSLRTLSDDPQTGLVQEQAVQLTIRFEWRDNRSGDVLVARDAYSASAVFHPSRAVAERLELGQRSAIQELAEDIVSEMRSGW
jgi:hypothetical protein